ncbi:hypothetical protein LDENG_00000700 [Lucifuga dentata]|nr:hypothetical protein LDENG_00000700 [Lucifuga dentata]
MAATVVFVLILVVTFSTDHVYSQDIYASQNPVPVDSNVTLFSRVNMSSVIWQHESTVIVVSFGGNFMITSTYKDRVTFNASTLALTIRSLQLQDSGLYTLQDLSSSSKAELNLSVEEPISDVTLRANATNLVEFNDTAVLMCSVSSGSSLSYVWLKGSSVVTASGRVQFSNGDATLTIVNVTRYDQGPFKCNVSNGVSSGISPLLNLNISYGPSNTSLTIMPKMAAYKTGSSIMLSCTAQSSPTATVQWLFDKSYLSHFGPKLHLEKVTQNQTGYYKCLFHNTVTSRFSSASAMIRIVDPISAVVVNNMGGMPILHESLTLHCEVTGPVDYIKWWRNGHMIVDSNTTVIDMKNKTLTLKSVHHSDNGYYQCQAFNAVSNMTSSPSKVRIVYGPENVTIAGPNFGVAGKSVTFICTASSYPTSHYKWYFNDSIVANTSEYVTPPLTSYMSGKYICVAYNNITDQNSSAYKMLTVIDKITHVEVEAPPKLAIYGHSYMLTCNVTGPVEHIYWMKNGMPLYTDNTTALSMDNKTVTFNPVEPDNAGDYQCKAVSAVENITSPSYRLTVIFGPETPNITGPSVAETGQYVHFMCSAVSVPPSQYSWWFNGSMVANTSELVLKNLHLNMSGEYTCVAFNNVTGKNSTNSKMLTVIPGIESVMIKYDTIPIDSKSFTLTCKVIGPYDSIYWMKDNMHLYINTTTNPYISTENNSLHFSPLTLYDDGTYQCVATNLIGPHKSPEYELKINYGPLSVFIIGPDSMQENSLFPVTLMCSAVSRPVCNFEWFYNQSHSVHETGPVISFLAIKKNEGRYTCKAMNPVTNITMYQTKTVRITDHASDLHLRSVSGMMFVALLASSVPVLSDWLFN